MARKLANIAPPAAYTPADFEIPDVAAIQALARGTASGEQQQRALNWLLNAAAGTYDLDYRPDPREHAFVSGRRFVGLQVVKMLKLDLAKLQKAGQSTKR